MIDRIKRIFLGVTIIAVVIGIAYGWALIHTALGLATIHYVTTICVVVATYIAYILGDIAMVVIDRNKEKSE